jgi:hypothetical protein
MLNLRVPSEWKKPTDCSNAKLALIALGPGARSSPPRGNTHRILAKIIVKDLDFRVKFSREKLRAGGGRLARFLGI